MMWQNNFGIKNYTSKKPFESFVFNESPKYIITFDDLIQSGAETVNFKKFGFMVKDCIYPTHLTKLFENIEKKYLLHLLLGVEQDKASEFIVKDGQFKIATQEYIEKLEIQNFDIELTNALIGKEVYFFNRMGWETKSQVDWLCDTHVTKSMARFNFLVLDKVAA